MRWEKTKGYCKSIKELRLNDNVTLHGILNIPELEEMYKIAHVNMMLSSNNKNTDFEGFGITVLEGNLYGVQRLVQRNQD